MFGRRWIGIPDELYGRLESTARHAGYSSADEFIRHALEKAAMPAEAGLADDEVVKRLKGLGYIE